jgi:hypothetical protein
VWARTGDGDWWRSVWTPTGDGQLVAAGVRAHGLDLGCSIAERR